jgi:hypothetical protein
MQAVCVCTVYHNVELMISGAKLYDLTEKQVKTYDKCLTKVTCNVPSVSCYQGDCNMCPGNVNLIKYTEQRFKSNTDNTTY